MKNSKAATRYAKAFYQFALEQKSEEVVYQDILLIKDTLEQCRDLKLAIESPIIQSKKKESIFKAIFQEKVAKITLDFLVLIIEKRREPELLSIANQFVAYYYEQHNIRLAYLTSAVKLSDPMIAHIKQILEEQTHSTILLKEFVDPKLVGGFVVKVDDFLFDASILGKINKLKNEFSQNLYTIKY